MSAIDERIVAMRFDNAQFEKGVRTSMRTLEDLKAASNLDDVAGNLSDFSNNFNKTLNFDGTAKDAGIFFKALTGLGKVAKKTFNASTFPLQALGRSLKSLGSYTRAMLGIDLASSLVNTGKTVLRAFTIDPLRSGWSEYELKMDSIKTIMTGTVDTYKKMMEKKNPGFLYDEEKHLDYVKQGLEELNTYADKTIYSFQDMTSNIGKFTNAGVDFETAVDAIKGISNAAAHAGQGSSQASSAMYNLSQALGMGYLGMMDWRSIENANMATLTFKQTLIDLGTAMGKLKKAEDGLTYLVDDKGNIDKNTQVTAENLRETLQKKWVDKEVLLAALSVYSGEYSAEEIKQLYHIMDDDVAKALADIGKEASKAATQVRTFTKMWDALKEAAQSGWATTWELIFGDMNEATDFWTSLNDRFSGILDGMADRRNDLLKRWRGQGRYWNYSTGEWYWKQVPDAKDGRKILIDGLNNLLDVLQRLGGAIGTAWEKVFGVLTADKLVSLTEKFSGFTSKLKTWLGDANKDGTRLNKITKGFQGLFGMLKGGGTLIKGAITTVANTLHLDKLIDLGINAFSGIGEWLTGVAGSIESVWNKIGQTEIAQKLSGFFSELWDSVSKFFGEVNPDTGKTGFAEWLESTTGRIAEIWETFTGSDFFQNASNFFSDLWKSVIGFFKPKGGLQETGSIIYEPSDFQVMVDNILGWFDDAWKTIEDKWTEFTNSDFYKNASKLFSDLWTSVIGFFTPKTIPGKMGNTIVLEESGFQIMIDNILGWFDGAWKTIEDKWTEFTNSDFYKNASNLFSDLWTSVIGFFKPKDVLQETGSIITEPSDFQVMIDNILGFFNDGWTTISGIWDTFKGTDFYKNASGFFTELYNSVSGFFSSAFTVPEGGSWDDSPIGKAVHTVFGWIESAGAWLDENLGPIAEGVGKFLTDTWGWIMDKMGWSESPKKGVQLPEGAKMVAFAATADVNYDSINKIPNDKKQSAFLDFFTKITEAVSGMVEKVKGWDKWKDIGDFFNSILEGIESIFSTITDITGLTMLESISSFITTLFDVFGKMVGTLMDAVIQYGNGDPWPLVRIGAILTALTGLLGVVSKFGANFAAGATAFTSLSAGLLLLSGAISVLGSLDQSTLLQGGSAVIGLIGVAYLIIQALSKYSAISSKSDHALAGWAKVTNNLVKGVMQNASFAIILSLLPGLLKSIGEVAKVGVNSGDILKVFEGLSIFFLSISAAAWITEKMGVNVASVGMAFLNLGVALVAAKALVDIIAGLWIGTDQLWDNKTNFEYATQFFESLGGLFGALVGGFTGQKDASYLVKLSEDADKINQDGMEQFRLAMSTLTEITKALPPDPDRLFGFFRFFTGEQSISNFTNDLPKVGSDIKKFMNNITGTDIFGKPIERDFDSINKGLGVLNTLVEAAKSVAMINQLTIGNSGYMLMEFLRQVVEDDLWGYDPGSYHDFDEILGPVESFVSLFNSSIEQAAVKINATPLIAAIEQQLISGDTKELISKAFQEMARYVFPESEQNEQAASLLSSFGGLFSGDFSSLFSGLLGGENTTPLDIKAMLGIPDGGFDVSSWFTGVDGKTVDFMSMLGIPEEKIDWKSLLNLDELNFLMENGGVSIGKDGYVYDASNLDDMPVLSLQNGTLVLSGTVSLDDSNVASITSAIHTEGSTIRTAIYSLGGRIDNVAAAIASMKIVLNTGVVAGAVDNSMGKAAVLQERTGTASGYNVKPNLPPLHVTPTEVPFGG